MGILEKIDHQLNAFPWFFRVLTGILLIFGFYAWIVFGFGLFGKLDILTDAAGVRVEALQIEPVISLNQK